MNTIKKVTSIVKTMLLTILTITFSGFIKAAEQPNILWLVIEDTSPYLFPAYGNKVIKTPNLDFIAEHGIVYNNAFATGPQCSPARSSLISGCDAATYGNDHHRQKRAVPEQYFFPPLMREAGYYCINQGKTDYNAKVSGRYINGTVWDENGKEATYNNPERGERPFFAMFNDFNTHMSRMTSVSIENRKPCRVHVEGEDLPSHVPDLPEVRSDYALHLESIVDADRWVGVFIDDLKKRGLLENTFIFFFSDHGGCLPRGKAFPYDTGFRSAFMAYIPEKWRHMIDEKIGTHSDRLVTFTDFGPTVLSLAGVKVPDYMQGVPFMGKFAKTKKKYAHTFRTNTGNHYDPSRTVYDGRFHYIRNFTPYKIHALRQSFQWGMPAQIAWDVQFHNGKALKQHRPYFEAKTTEMLFDLKNDPYEMKNLAETPEYRSKLIELRNEVINHMNEIVDLGVFPPDVRGILQEKNNLSLYEEVRKNNYPIHDLIKLANKSASANLNDAGYFESLLSSSDPAFRFWAVSGLANLYANGYKGKVPQTIKEMMFDTVESVAATSAEAMVYGGFEEQGIDALIRLFLQGNNAAASSLEEIQHAFTLNKTQKDKLEKAYRIKGMNNFQIRSLLINESIIPMDSLFTQKEKDKFFRGYLNRIKTWDPTRP